MYRRRKNSSSDDNDACGTPSLSIFPNMNSSMRFLRGTGVDATSALDGRSCSVRSDATDLLFVETTGGWSFGTTAGATGACAPRTEAISRSRHPMPSGRMPPPCDEQLGRVIYRLIVGRSGSSVNKYGARSHQLVPRIIAAFRCQRMILRILCARR